MREWFSSRTVLHISQSRLRSTSLTSSTELYVKCGDLLNNDVNDGESMFYVFLHWNTEPVCHAGSYRFHIISAF